MAGGREREVHTICRLQTLINERLLDSCYIGQVSRFESDKEGRMSEYRIALKGLRLETWTRRLHETFWNQ